MLESHPTENRLHSFLTVRVETSAKAQIDVLEFGIQGMDFDRIQTRIRL